MKKIISTMLMILVLVSSCAPKTNLIDSKWQLNDLSGQAIPADVTVTLNLGSDSIGGSDGCNSYGGSYTDGKASIQFGEDIFHTEMYCNDEIQTVSTAYYAALVQATAYELSGDRLILRDANGTVLAEFIKSVN